ncbi:MAG: ATP12 chaperone family protein [Alphaproteobacteria bacterium]|nr:ATP12 chaperone family protein [Alphaproteobacteria bacterium]
MKRFYKLVSTAAEAGGFAVLLDGKPVKTPGRVPLLAPTSALADAIMAEWAAQKEIIDPDSMPLTQILTTTIDRVIPMRDEISAQVLNYLDTDLVCYLAAGPEVVVAVQAEQWDPVRAWFMSRFGVSLLTTTALTALRQPQVAHDAVASVVMTLDDYRFSAFQLVVATTGSLVLALGFMDGAWGADKLFSAMHVEEDYKAALYNEDFYGRAPNQEKRENAVRIDLQAAQDFIALL